MLETIWFFMFVGFMGFVEFEDSRQKRGHKNSIFQYLSLRVSLWIFDQKLKRHLRESRNFGSFPFNGKEKRSEKDDPSSA